MTPNIELEDDVKTKQNLRIVLSSPNDVKEEREIMEDVIQELNRGIADDRNLRLELSRWETDAYPGFHAEGPQGLIDPILKVEDCDILIGIFWKRFGTPTKNAQSGTEHEIRTAIHSWQKSGRPQIMIYFKEAGFITQDRAALKQYDLVLRFREQFPKEGLYWAFTDVAEFERLVRNQLTNFIRSQFDRSWAEVNRGGIRKTSARLTGSGAIAQDSGARAVGERGVLIEGDLKDSVVVTGDDSRAYANIYTGAPARDRAESLRIFRRMLIGTERYLPLRGVELAASDPSAVRKPLELARVYVDPDTKSQVPVKKGRQKKRDRAAALEERGMRPLRALEAAAANRFLVVTGGPGSGKSTFVNHLSLCLAGSGLEPDGNWLRRIPGWPEAQGEVVPIPVLLRDFARRLPKDEEKAAPRHLWDFIVGRLKAQNMEFVVDPLHELLDEGQAIALLDGLDEIPTAGQRTFVRDAAAAFADRYPLSRMIVTCRVLSYQDPAWQLPNFPAFELAPFSEEMIDRFIEAWYTELARLGEVKTDEASKGLAARLKDAVRRSDLWRLAANPLLLTVMALVHTHQGRLPEARGKLYEETLDILLWRWDQIKAGAEKTQPRLSELLLDAERSEIDLKGLLGRLAFDAHQANEEPEGEALADIKEWELVNALAQLHPNKSLDWANQVINTIKFRAGVLLEREPGVYSFPHRTFQEYLAGSYLSGRADFAQRASNLVEESALWREVILLAVGRLVYLAIDFDKPLALISELCPQQAVNAENAWRKAWLAGEALLEIGLNRISATVTGKDLLSRVQNRLTDLLETGALTPVERVAAGAVLGRLGDPRPEVITVDEMLFSHIPAGPFWMGEEGDEHLYEFLDYDYWIGRYPVTNSQFNEFVKEDGYGERRFWTEAEQDDYWKEGRTMGRYDREGLSEPRYLGLPFNLLNHPVVGITWYEALAFTRWLTERWEQKGLMPGNYCLRLPTETEWEKAARGGLNLPQQVLVAKVSDFQQVKEAGSCDRENPSPGRIYPWEDELVAKGPDPEKANYEDLQIVATSAVGCFPAGASPYGVLDMSGNVWEWTQSIDKGYPYDPSDEREDLMSGGSRVLRGGSFDASAMDLRCACRIRNYPVYWNWFSGFRVVVAPCFSSDL